MLLLLSTVLLAEALDAVGSVPSLGVVPSLNLEGSVDFQDIAKLEGFFPETLGEAKPDLEIIGVTETAYIRAVIFGIYTNGGWKTPASDPFPYRGENIPPQVTVYSEAKEVEFRVNLLKNQKGYIPAVLNTRRISPDLSLEYYKETQTFFAKEAIDEEYRVTYTRYTYDEETLRNTPVEEMIYYLQIPDKLKENIHAMAEEITEGHHTDFDKILALTEYLYENYVYNLKFEKAPPGYEPMEWFLHGSKEGVCMQFNSALVLLARSIGIPGRLVGGYSVHPNALKQEVYPDRRHAYAEFPFENLGWITFDATPSAGGSEGEGIEGEGEEGQEVETQDEVQDEKQAGDAVDTSLRLPAECGPCSENTPLFSVYGETGTAYLRNMVGEEYDGTWSMVEALPTTYEGEILQPSVSGYSEYSTYGFQVSPLQEMGGFIPSALYTRKLDIEWPLQSYDDHQIYFSPRTFESPYRVFYNRYKYTEDTLNSATPILNQRYLNVPSQLLDNLRPLAESITQDYDTPFEKLKALEAYLKENYEYDENYDLSPSDIDPVEWFLFHEQRGVCANFNSAFVLLARSIGLPARLVGGYLIDPVSESQTVGAKQRHAYAEVPFEDLGWITFDATGLGNGTTSVGEATGEPDVVEEIEEEQEGELEPQEDLTEEDAVDTSTLMPSEGALGATIPLFSIYGAPGTAYLRTVVGEQYDGEWNITEPSPVSYSGGLLRPSVTGYRSAATYRFIVKPVAEMGGFIPTPIHTTELNLQGPTQYYPDEAVFFSQEIFQNSYSVSFNQYEFDVGALRDAELLQDQQYTGVPTQILGGLRSLALTVTGGEATPYEKLRALESYLRDNYVYDENYTRAPAGVDPVEWFLFQEKRGVCANFNSAFVLLARSIGIPARLVGGYLVAPTAEIQNVTARQRHSYAEVPFLEVGWITFDATPVEDLMPSVPGLPSPETRIPTLTVITQQDPTGVRGFEFVAIGEVTDVYGGSVDGLTTLVYVKEDKNETGLLCGEGDVVDGSFNITCGIPLDLDIGEYHVEAHTLGDSRYIESWSDPPLTIVQRTEITLEVPEKWISGRQFTFEGNLTEYWTGEPIPDTICRLHVGEATYTYMTDDEGALGGLHTLSAPGNYNMTLSFSGTTYFLASNDTRSIRVIPLKIYQDPLETFIRLESVEITGTAMAEDLPGDGERVAISIDGTRIGTTKANEEGNFTLHYVVPAGQELGDIIVGYTLQSNSFTVNSLTNVFARTSISISAPETVETGEALNITARLIDDLGNPIADTDVTLEYLKKAKLNSIERSTDENGEASLQLLYEGFGEASKLYYNASFSGSRYYFSSNATGALEVIVPPGGGGLFGFIKSNQAALLLGVGVLASGVGGYFLVYRREEGLQGLLEPARASLETYVEGKTRMELQLNFPQIRPPLPDVWGVGDSLLVKAQLTSGEGSVEGLMLQATFQDGETKDIDLDDEGWGKMEYTFEEKGPHKVTVRFLGDEGRGAAKAEAELRIVDYREEILDLFNTFSDEHRSSKDEIKDHFTAREAMYVLMKYAPESVHNPLEELTTIFEIADYSTHDIRRGEYERFYVAKEEFRLDE